MRIAVIGAGAMGSLYGAKLALAGNDVTMVDVVPSVVETISKRGLILEEGQNEHNPEVKACFGQELKEPAELVILFTKTMHSRAALDSVKGVLDKRTCLLSVQNGLGNIELISEYLPISQVIVGTTMFDSFLLGPGHVRTSSSGLMSIMSADGVKNDLVVKMNELFNAAGLSCVIVENIMEAIWEKVAFNAATNTLAALTRLPDGLTIGTEETKELAQKIAKEVVMVARASGVNASEDKVIGKLGITVAEHGNHFPSMGQDILRKSQTEIESINGAVYRIAQTLGLEVPYTETMYRLVRTIEKNYAEQM